MVLRAFMRAELPILLPRTRVRASAISREGADWICDMSFHKCSEPGARKSLVLGERESVSLYI